MITEAIDFNYLLIENYRKLKIKENELATIFVIDHLINQGNSLITADLLALKMNLTVVEIDNILANLLTKGYFEYVMSGNKMIASLNPLRKKLYHEFQTSLNMEAEDSSSSYLKEEMNKTISSYEKLLERSLSPVEKNRVQEWIVAGYNSDSLISALKEALEKGKKTLRSVDKILVAWSQKEDLKSEGHTPINDEWDKNLEETIKIIKTPWIKK